MQDHKQRRTRVPEIAQGRGGIRGVVCVLLRSFVGPLRVEIRRLFDDEGPVIPDAQPSRSFVLITMVTTRGWMMYKLCIALHVATSLINLIISTQYPVPIAFLL